LAVLDGKRLPEGPVAKIHFDHAVPVTFHGVFVAAPN
jgi:carotenoid cleavage dioxygenase-like enzyme